MSTEIDDIGSLAAVDTDTFQLLHPATDEPLTSGGQPVTVTIYGPGSEKQAKAEVDTANRNMKRYRKKGEVILTVGGVAEDTADELTAIVERFDNLKHEGEIVGGDKGRIKALFMDRSLSWIGDQINERRKNWAHFMRRSATS